MATQKLRRFLKKLEEYCDTMGLTLPTFLGGARRSRHLIEIDTSPRPKTVLCVKDSSDSPGFWGLNENQLYALRDSGANWYVALLVGSGETAYVLNNKQVDEATRNKKWSFSNTDWKIHEGELVKTALKFEAFQVLFDKIILPPATPKAADIQESLQPRRVLQETYRVLRDTRLSHAVKALAGYRCQICGESIRLTNDLLYAEAHHVRPLGNPYEGPDVQENIICVCPNHHVLLDYGAIRMDAKALKGIGAKYIDYHNNIFLVKCECITNR